MINLFRVTRVVLYLHLGACLCTPKLTSAAPDSLVFERDVLPIFSRHCFTCHGKSSPQAGLELRTAKQALRGGHNGRVVVPGAPDESPLWQKVSSREMPPKAFERKLTDLELATIRQWIEQGARFEGAADLPAVARQQLDRFEHQVQPIFAQHCHACHGEEDPAGDLDLTQLATLLRGSINGPVIVEGFSDKSVLIRKVASRAMPPPDHGDPLTRNELAVISQWVDKGNFADYVEVAPRRSHESTEADEGALDDRQQDLWAFQTPRSAPLPTVRRTDVVRTPIDRWVLAKLEAAGLTFSPDAPPKTLVRRAYFDLIGLPPTPRQVTDFLDDDPAGAYERLIDRLLDSPHYGERWGRHWLDAVGYVDTTGKDFDAKKGALADGMWRYRDYVIKATNADKPWDRFLIEQIAGDELVDWRNAESYTPEMLDLLTATGYLRGVLDATDEDISNLPFDRYEAMFKLMEKVSTSALGLTLACARCHTHKFDPIPQRDYYRFMALFAAAYNPSDWLQPRDRFVYHVSRQEQQAIEKRNTEIDQAIKQLEGELSSIRRPYKERLLEQRLVQVPAERRAAAREAIEALPAKRTAEQKTLVEEFGELLRVTDDQVNAGLAESDRLSIARTEKEIVAHQGGRRPLQKVQSLWDVGAAPTMRLLQRGDVEMPGPQVTPGFLTALTAGGSTDAVPSSRAVGETTGLRLALAEWLTSRTHPLTARVIVNRIWHHHFGRGIVATPGNFGTTGSPPTHPELLDWLAVDFMEHGWSAKRLHRLIMMSTVYRQASSRRQAEESALEPGPAAIATANDRPDRRQIDFPDQGRQTADGRSSPQQVDPGNHLLWRMNLRRLEAEAVRDSVLSVSGQLDTALGGPPVMLEMRPGGLQAVHDSGSASGQQRRSVYVLARRTYPLSLLSMFDYPIIDASCTRRVPSATPLQSLAMINSDFFTTAAVRLADRVQSLAGPRATVEQRIQVAYLVTLARPPTDDEVQAGADHLRRLLDLFAADEHDKAQSVELSFQNLVHMLLCSNEFLYLD